MGSLSIKIAQFYVRKYVPANKLDSQKRCLRYYPDKPSFSNMSTFIVREFHFHRCWRTSRNSTNSKVFWRGNSSQFIALDVCSRECWASCSNVAIIFRHICDLQRWPWFMMERTHRRENKAQRLSIYLNYEGKFTFEKQRRFELRIVVTS